MDGIEENRNERRITILHWDWNCNSFYGVWNCICSIDEETGKGIAGRTHPGIRGKTSLIRSFYENRTAVD